MRSLKLRLGLLCGATILTLGLSHVAAQAACPQQEFGGNVYGDYNCMLRNVCQGWCYYNCTCSNVFPGFSCDDVLRKAGFDLAAVPEC